MRRRSGTTDTVGSKYKKYPRDKCGDEAQSGFLRCPRHFFNRIFFEQGSLRYLRNLLYYETIVLSVTSSPMVFARSCGILLSTHCSQCSRILGRTLVCQAQ